MGGRAGPGGSVLNLESDTSYEVRFDLADPDGGEGRQTVTVATRAVPAENLPGKRRVHVYPADYQGKRGEAGGIRPG